MFNAGKDLWYINCFKLAFTYNMLYDQFCVICLTRSPMNRKYTSATQEKLYWKSTAGSTKKEILTEVFAN